MDRGSSFYWGDKIHHIATGNFSIEQLVVYATIAHALSTPAATCWSMMKA
jgi:hypothetical protein